jgi:hypothetical protein
MTWAVDRPVAGVEVDLRPEQSEANSAKKSEYRSIVAPTGPAKWSPPTRRRQPNSRPMSVTRRDHPVGAHLIRNDDV